MKTENTQYQSISSLLDGELDDAQWESAFAMLSDESNLACKKTWGIYHQIGDVLRSDDLAIRVSPDFSSRFSALLEAEPVVLAPRGRPETGAANKSVNDSLAVANSRHSDRSGWARYMAMTSMAAAAAVAFFMAPQIIPMLSGSSNAGLQISKIEPQSEIQGQTQSAGIQLTSNVIAQEPAVKLTQQIEMLRDPRLDSYLMAHQKFSPSIGNGSQYVTRANTVSAASSASEK